ncbi:hypothetical protein JXA88_14100 [Candidatus Fermentibacteria bacterium]|nr:hypothetical protein [Candidatus Fermentibacteria bacterium]
MTQRFPLCHCSRRAFAPWLSISLMFLVAPPSRATIYVVSSTADGGAGTLRNQITAANANPGADQIIFAISGTGPHTIQPLSALPTIADTLTIDGYTQAGSSPASGMTPATLMIMLDGSQAGFSASGFKIMAGGCVARGLAIGNFGKSGIYIENAGGALIEGNHIGTDVSGTAAAGNQIEGVLLLNAWNNSVGGVAAGQRNVISGGVNYGVWIAGSASAGNVVLGNYIGTDASGSSALGNGINGICLNSCHDNTVGGAIEGARNVIAGNFGRGIDLLDNAEHNEIQGNSIGVNAFGEPLGNGGPGILFLGENIENNRIGGLIEGEGNLIGHNGGHGIAGFGASCVGNTFLSNSIRSNGGLGISLAGTDPTPNDPDDGDTGCNNLQNHPILAINDPGPPLTLVDVYLNSTPSTTFHFEFFSNEGLDDTGFGEGETYLGWASWTTDGSGDAAFTVFFDPPVLQGHTITATATDPSGNTSEFSQVARIGPGIGLAGAIAPGILELGWTEFPGVVEYWTYGAAQNPYFVPEFVPPYAHRIDVYPAGTTTTGYPYGIGDADWNWTYLVAGIGWYGQVVTISNRFGEWDYAGDIP